MQLQWTGDDHPRPLLHKVVLKGAKSPKDYFYIRLSPAILGRDVNRLASSPFFHSGVRGQGHYMAEEDLEKLSRPCFLWCCLIRKGCDHIHQFFWWCLFGFLVTRFMSTQSKLILCKLLLPMWLRPCPKCPTYNNCLAEEGLTARLVLQLLQLWWSIRHQKELIMIGAFSIYILAQKIVLEVFL